MSVECVSQKSPYGPHGIAIDTGVRSECQHGKVSLCITIFVDVNFMSLYT